MCLSMAMPNMKLIGEFLTQLEMPQAFWTFLYKMAARGHFVFPIYAKNHKVLVIWDRNGYGEYEFDWCICDKVMACSTSVGVRRRWRRRRRRNQKYNTPEVFKFRGYNKYVANEGLVLYIGGDYSLRPECYVTCTICQHVRWRCDTRHVRQNQARWLARRRPELFGG